MSESPPPAHILRSHSSQLTTLAFSDDNQRIYSGDGSGLVVVTSTRSLRAITSWKAHSDGLLGVQEFGEYIITHGRDNKLHLWSRIEELPSSASIRLGGSAVLPDLPTPVLCHSMDVNALNYCRFSLLPLQSVTTSGLKMNKAKPHQTHALIALPNLVESSLADIWTLPSCKRHHAAIGKAADAAPKFTADNAGRSATGIIMSMHLFAVPPAQLQDSTSNGDSNELRLLCAYENGGVTLWRFIKRDGQTSVEGIGWEAVWSVKLHVETVMAMAVSRNNTLALTVSADHLVGRYDLLDAENPLSSPVSACVARKTKHPGNAAIAIRDDGKVCAVGGWDGKIRLYSTRTMKPLGSLAYHKSTCQAVAFARSLPESVTSVDSNTPTGDEYDDEDQMSVEEKVEKSRWLTGGGKDNRVSIWSLISFAKSGT